MRKSASALLALAGCEYDVPVTEKPTRTVDSRLLGDWIAMGGGIAERVRPLDATLRPEHDWQNRLRRACSN